MMHQAPELSPRTRQAVQDYTALNTITAAAESMYAGEAEPWQLELLVALGDCDEPLRVPLNCELGRRMMKVNLIRAAGVASTRGVVRRRGWRMPS